MILCVLGGSAHSTPVLIDALARVIPDSPITVRLAGRSFDHLSSVQRACEILALRSCLKIEIFGEGEWDLAITGSAIILVQTRDGGYEARNFDETFPIQFGIPGDEGLGPGGLSAAFRAWPQMKSLFYVIRASAPHARVILLSSPSSLFIRLANLTFPGWPIFGTCELPFTTLKHLCFLAGKHFKDVSFEYVGVNHLGFLYDVHGPIDLLKEYEAHSQSGAFPSISLVRRLNAYPLKYLRMHYDLEQVVGEQRERTGTRAKELTSLAKNAFQAFRTGDEAIIRNALALRQVGWYEHGVLPLLLSAMNRTVDEPIFLTSATNTGDVLERAYSFQGGEWSPMISQRAAPAEAGDLVARFITYERAATEAILLGTEEALADALRLHPWVKNGYQQALARAIVAQPFARSY